MEGNVTMDWAIVGKVLGLIFQAGLAVLGAISGLVWLRNRWRTSRERARIRKASRRESFEYFYRSFELGARISNQGVLWNTRRLVDVVSLVDGLKGVPAGLCPLNRLGEAAAELSPASLELKTEAKDNRTGFEHFLICPKAPLNEGDELQYTLSYSFRKASRPESDHFQLENSVRTDRLTLRVVFVDVIPSSVVFRESDGRHRAVREIPVMPDPISLEYSKTETNLQTGHSYSIMWTY